MRRAKQGLFVFLATLGFAAGITAWGYAQGPAVLRTSAGAELGTASTPLRTDPTGSTAQPVTGTFWQTTQPVSGTFWQATQPISASALPLPTGAATETTLAGVLTTSDFDTKAGSLTESAPATDTGSSGLNGRLQRIAQRLTSLITALGSPFQAGGSIGNSSFGTTNFPTTVDTNSGNKSNSTLRTTAATDSLAIPTWGHGATGSAAPSGATQAGFLTGDATTGGHMKTPIYCDSYAKDRSTTADVELVSLTSTQVVYICRYNITGESTTTSDVSLEYGTGTACATGTTGLTPPRSIGTSTSGGMIAGIAAGGDFWQGLKGAASNAVCVHRSAVQTSEIEIWYTKF